MNSTLLNSEPRVVTGFQDSTSLLSNPEALRNRATEDGYLFFKGFLPKEPLLTLRRQILEILAAKGWLKEGTDMMDGIADIDAVAREKDPNSYWKYVGVSEETYRKVQSLELFHAIPHHARFMSLFETLFGTPAFLHPRNVARVLVPPIAMPTPAHQDFIYIQGTREVWSCWFPLGDCPLELGGLSVLRGSNHEGVLPVRAAEGAGARVAMLCKHDYEWVQGNYECGDVIIFESHTLHKGLPNQKKERIRLSCDIRYQPANQEIEKNSLEPHMNIAKWEDLYRGWKSDDFKYYWKSRELKFTPYDETLTALAEKIC
jgi:hypothetical protein